MEAEHVKEKANPIPLRKKSNKKKKLSKPKLDKKTRKKLETQFNAELVNKLLAQEISRLQGKIEVLKARHPRREKKPPTAKQMKQWGEFAGRVAKAKEIYYSQEERTTEAWSRAMKAVNVKEDEMPLATEYLDALTDGPLESGEKSD
jgi:hypothetical protein